MGLIADPRLGPDKKLNLIKLWLKVNIGQDGAMENRFSPTRLLDLSKEGEVRLVQCVPDGSDLDPAQVSPPDYVALSHRWGASQHLTVTTQTLLQLSEGISIERLPETFRDAVFVTQQLGPHHLWIDALCIIQDSEEDWLKESDKMGDIFRGAKFTIAGHCAGDDSEGFLSLALSKRDAVAHHTSVYSVGLCRPPNPEVDITNSGLSRRGWVLQERFLSTRTLHFTPGQIYFETINGVLCEDGSLISASKDRTRQAERKRTDLRPNLFGPSSLPELRTLLGFGSGEIPTTSLRLTSLEWLDLVEMYSHCGLTKDSDKLIAISGMARKIHVTTEQSWCVGIWADKICQGLLWLPENSALIQPSRPRAPSWSWASWDGAIQYPLTVREPDFRPRCQFVSLRNQHNENVSWLNGLGELTIRGRLMCLEGLMWGENLHLGPGLPRKGKITNDSSNLPRLSLKNYVRVRSLYDKCYLNPPPHAFTSRPDYPHGWVAFDSAETMFEPYRSGSSTREFLLAGACRMATPPPRLDEYFLIIGTLVESQKAWRAFADPRIICLGIFLTSSGDNEKRVYRRHGMGQLSRYYLKWQLDRILKSGQYRSQDVEMPWDDNFFVEEKLTTITIE